MALPGISAANSPDINDKKKEVFLFVGTYDNEYHRGIYVFRFNMLTGDCTETGAAEISNPSYLTPSADGKYVYAISELGATDAAVAAAFSFDRKTGELKFLNSRHTGDPDPCYVTVDGGNRFVVTANYSGGSVTVFLVSEKNGTLLPYVQLFKFHGSGPDGVRQKSPHLHCVVFSPGQRYLFASDLGSDKIYRFEVRYDDPSFPLQYTGAFSLDPGTGPRHIAFHPSGKYMYLIGELSGKVSVLQYENGDMTLVQTVVADTVEGRGSADIHVSPDGTYLYVSNRLKDDGIAIFAINLHSGELTWTGYQPTGMHPRSFVITPDGNYLLVACRDENAVQVFVRDAATGLLTDTGKKIQAERPVCLKLLEAE